MLRAGLRVQGQGVMDEDRELALLLVTLGKHAGGRVDPARILQRPPTSPSRAAWHYALDAGWLDANGYVTQVGLAALEDSDD